jgi:hypothetical protein
LRTASESLDPDDDMARWPLDRVIDRIVRVHHAYVHAAVGRLRHVAGVL